MSYQLLTTIPKYVQDYASSRLRLNDHTSTYFSILLLKLHNRKSIIVTTSYGFSFVANNDNWVKAN